MAQISSQETVSKVAPQFELAPPETLRIPPPTTAPESLNDNKSVGKRMVETLLAILKKPAKSPAQEKFYSHEPRLSSQEAGYYYMYQPETFDGEGGLNDRQQTDPTFTGIRVGFQLNKEGVLEENKPGKLITAQEALTQIRQDYLAEISHFRPAVRWAIIEREIKNLERLQTRFQESSEIEVTRWKLRERLNSSRNLLIELNKKGVLTADQQKHLHKSFPDLELYTKPSTSPEFIPRLSRREFLKQVGIRGGKAYAAYRVLMAAPLTSLLTEPAARAEALASGETGKPPLNFAIRAAVDLEGLALLTHAKNVSPELLKTAFTLVSATGEKIDEALLAQFSGYLAKQNLTAADLRAFILAVEKEGLDGDVNPYTGDGFVMGIHEAAKNGAGGVISFLQVQSDDFSPNNSYLRDQMSRVVKTHQLSKELGDFASLKVNLLERLGIDRSSLEVQLLIAGVPKGKVSEIMARPGEIVREGNIVLIRTAKPLVLEIDPKNSAEAETNFKFIGAILSKMGNPDYDKALTAASNNKNISYSKFLTLAAQKDQEAPMAYPNIFLLISQEINPEGKFPQNEVLLRQAMTGDPVAFNQLASKLKNQTVFTLLKPREFHATRANSIFDDVFDRLQGKTGSEVKQNALNRLAFAARKAGLIPVTPEIPAPTTGAEIFGEATVTREKITTETVINGDVPINEVVRAILSEKTPKITLGVSGLEAQVIPAIMFPKENYSEETLRLLEALEGSVKQDYLGGNGKIYLMQLAKKYAQTRGVSATESGGTVPATGLMKMLKNEVPGIFHPEQYDKDYALELVKQIWNKDGETPGESQFWAIAENVLQGAPEKINRLCANLESFIAATSALKSQPEKDFMNAYLNLVVGGSIAGRQVIGLNAVCQNMFGPGIDEISLGRKAMAFQFIQSPVSKTTGGKFTHRFAREIFGTDLLDGKQLLQLLCQRGNWVLDQWQKKGVITQEQYDQGAAEIDLIARINRPLSWTVPKGLETDLEVIKTTHSEQPEILKTSFGSVIDYTDNHRFSLETKPPPERATRPEIQKIFDDYFNGMRFNPKRRVFLGATHAKGQDPGLLPTYELWDPVQEKVVVKPGYYYVVTDSDGKVVAEGGPALTFSSKVRPGSTNKLMAAVYLASQEIDINHRFFDNRPGNLKENPATLDGTSERVLNTAGGGDYTPFMNSKNPLNRLTVMGSLKGPSSNVAIQGAGREVAQKNPDWWQSYVTLLKKYGAEPVVMQSNSQTGKVEFVVPSDPDAMAFLGSSTWTDVEGARKFFSCVANPGLAFPEDRPFFEEVKKGMLNDNRQISPLGGPIIGDRMFKKVQSTIDGVDHNRITKTGTTVVGGKLTNDTGAVVKSFRSDSKDPSKYMTIFGIVSSERWNGNGYDHVPMDITVSPDKAWASQTLEPAFDELRWRIQRSLGVIKETKPEPKKTTTGMTQYKIVYRDTLTSIATRFGISLQDLIDANGITDLKKPINPGQILFIPVKKR